MREAMHEAPPPRLPGRLDAEALAEALDPDAALRSLLLALMSRLLAPRGIAALSVEGVMHVEAVKGSIDLRPGDRVPGDVGRLRGPCVAGAVPAPLRRLGLELVVPLRHGRAVVGALALGGKATGEAFSSSEVALARSLSGAAAASVQAAQTGRALAARAQELRTLLELAQAFGRSLDREAVIKRLVFALMGRWMTPRILVALRDDASGALEVVSARGVSEDVTCPEGLADLDHPAPISDAMCSEAGLAWAIPLRAGDVSRGAVILGPRAGSEAYDQADATFGAALAALAVGALETVDRVAERVERERLEEEMRLAREIQERLLPECLPEAQHVRVSAFWRPGAAVSGDFYDVADVGEGRLLVAVADGMGHGAPAALLAATLQAGLRLLRTEAATADADLGAITQRLNRLVCASTEVSQFVTLVWGVLDVNSGILRVVNAGHPAPMVMRAGGGVERLATGGPLLGVIGAAAYETGAVTLREGDAVLLFTDGATERRSAAGEEFGDERLAAAMQAALRTETALDHLVTALDNFAEEEESDDLTLLLLRS